MKSIVIMILMCPLISLAQYPKRANLAIMETDSLSGLFLFKECIDVLKSEGYQLKRSDYSTLYLQTRPVEIHELPLFFKLEIEVKGTLVSIRGFIRDGRNTFRKGFPEISKPWKEATFRSFRGSTWRTGFKVVAVIVEKIRSRTSGKTRWYHHK